MPLAVRDGRLGMQPPQMQSPPPPGQRQSLRSFLRAFDASFRNVWFYVAVMLLIINVSYTFRPQLQISASSIVTNDPAATLFTLINIGPWTLTNIEVGCDIFAGDQLILRSADIQIERSPEAALLGSSRISALAQGDPATRDCGISLTRDLDHVTVAPAVLRIDVFAFYSWFWGIWRSDAVVRHFNTRGVGEGRYILVPDVERAR